MKKLLGVIFLLSSMLAYSQQDCDAQLQYKRDIAKKHDIVKQIELLHDQRRSAHYFQSYRCKLYQEPDGSSKLAKFGNSAFIEYNGIPVCLMMNPQLQEAVRHNADKERNQALQGYCRALDKINARIMESSHNSSSEGTMLESGSMSPAVSLGQTTNASESSYTRSSSSSIISSDDIDESGSAKSLIIPQNVKTLMQARCARELSLQSHKKFELEQKNKQNILLQRHEAEVYLSRVAQNAIRQQAKYYKLLQQDKKSFLREEGRILQHQEKQKRTQQSLKDIGLNACKKCAIEDDKKNAQQLELQRRQIQQALAREKNQKIAAKKAVDSRSHRYASMLFTLSQIYNQDGQVVDSNKLLTTRAEQALLHIIQEDFEKSQLCIEKNGMDANDFVCNVIIKPAVRILDKSDVDINLFATAVLDRAQQHIQKDFKPEQKDYFATVFEDVYLVNKAIHTKINELPKNKK